MDGTSGDSETKMELEPGANKTCLTQLKHPVLIGELFGQPFGNRSGFNIIHFFPGLRQRNSLSYLVINKKVYE